MNKNTLFFAAIIASSTLMADESTVSTFIPKEYTWSMTWSAQDDSDLTTISNINAQARDLIAHAQRGENSGLFEKFLVFLKETYEAVLAGLNLVTAVTSREESLPELVEEVVEVIVENQLSDEVSVSEEVASNQGNETENKKMVTLAISLALDSAEDSEAYEILKSRLEALSENIQNKVASNDEIFATMIEVSAYKGSNITLLAQ